MFEVAICDKCGGEIAFRYVDGVLRPLHIGGGLCDGLERVTEPVPRHGWTHDCYLDPNASCPVCGARVYFYQSRHGGRVLFDDVGWPWPKHGCTDDDQRSIRVKRAPSGRSRVFRDKSGALLKIYDLDDIEDRGRNYLLVLRNQMTGSRVRVLVGKTRLSQGNIRLADFQDAPSIVVHEFEQGASHIRLDFVCVRLGKVARVKLRAAR
ncbi:hypothetical protein [Rhodobacter capsulatus]|uniref:hypothetical protein n=1 Tax=Rhodobacter capsulatus TaxID=1061 RepID=UPI00201605D8|nr:hypothetical protein [Rhodobacter capsulatus]